jgi:serine/threonine protein kinase
MLKKHMRGGSSNSGSKEWNLLSEGAQGVVLSRGNRIMKILPEAQEREVLFWSRVVWKDEEDKKKMFVVPDNIELKKNWKPPFSCYPEGNYYIMEMDRKQESLEKHLRAHLLTVPLEKRVLLQMKEILGFLNDQGFVHADMHLKNILKQGNRFYLIDFGLVMHRSFCQTVQETMLCEMYLWSRDDFFTLCLVLVFFGQDGLRIKKNDYKKLRSKSIKYFSKQPVAWIEMKKTLQTTFDFHKHDDYLFCFQHFIQNFLTASSQLAPRKGIYAYDILTKIFLDRLFLLVAVWHPDCLRLHLNQDRKIMYKELIEEFSKKA